MIFPLAPVVRFVKNLLGKGERPCTHCRAMNPDEKVWKDCCIVRQIGPCVWYRCCECGREHEESFQTM